MTDRPTKLPSIPEPPPEGPDAREEPATHESAATAKHPETTEPVEPQKPNKSMISTFRRRTADGFMLATFVIDERECESPAEMKSIRNEALIEIQRRRIVGEFETRRARAGELPSTLPRWAEYKRHLEAADQESSPQMSFPSSHAQRLSRRPRRGG
ncbi:hypothetical protein [Streptomyces sp. NPDC054975]